MSPFAVFRLIIIHRSSGAEDALVSGRWGRGHADDIQLSQQGDTIGTLCETWSHAIAALWGCPGRDFFWNTAVALLVDFVRACPMRNTATLVLTQMLIANFNFPLWREMEVGVPGEPNTGDGLQTTSCTYLAGSCG